MAFGKPQYMWFACQMALSIKALTKYPVQLISDGSVGYIPNSYRQLIDEWTFMKPEHLRRNGNIDPGWAKVNIYPYLVFDESIYLDVDGIVINGQKTLSDAFELCNEFYHAEVIGIGKKEDKIEYSIWAEHKNIWKHFGLEEDQELASVQSSFQYYRKSPEAQKLHSLMVKYYDFPVNELSNTWGGTIPDELIISGACAKMKHIPILNDGRGPEDKVVFFGHKRNKLTIPQIKQKYAVLSLYGNGKRQRLVSSTYLDYYDRLLYAYGRQMNIQPIQKAFQLMKHKHVG